MGNALRIFTVRGIDVRVDASWLVIAALVTWSFWGRFTSLHDRGGKLALGMAVVGALLFFASVLLHELAHSLEAKRRGVQVSGITLFLFGGVTETSFDVKRPRDEFALTAVGPFTSIVLGAAFGLVATAADGTMDVVAEVAGLIGWINVALGLFNLIPGAPLDGGRILRSIVWWITGDRRRAIVVAANSGRIFGMLLIGLGIAQFLFIPGAFVGGVWLALIGWFLLRAAMAERMQVELSEALDDVQVGDLVLGAEPVEADARADEVADRWRRSEAPDVLPVHDGGHLVGVLTIDELRRGGPQARVRDVMTPSDELPRVDASEDAADLLEHFDRRGVVIAVDGDRPVGLVTADRFLDAARRARNLRDVQPA